jgi:hypothetical protein
MKGILTQIFVGLGVLFLILVLFALYFFITDPFNIKPILFGSAGSGTQTEKMTVTPKASEDTSETNASAPQAAVGFELSSEQKQALVSFGIDPSAVPTTISTEQEACFVNALGEARIGEVKAGAVPSAYEFFKAKACI